MNSAAKTDVAVIGAGPVGLFAVFQCGMLGMRCAVIDSLEAVGGQCTALYPDKPIYDIPAHPAISGGELIKQLSLQVAPFRPAYHLGQIVTRLDSRSDGSIGVQLSGGLALIARAVIIAAGGGTLTPNRPPIAGIERYEGRHVLYSVANTEALRGRRIVLAGGGDSAVDWANALVGIADKVSVVHRRAKFRAAPASVDRMMALVGQGLIELAIPYQLHGLRGDGDRLSAVTVVDDRGVVRELEADILIPLFGIASQLGPIANWGLELDGGCIAVSWETCETSIPGVYAVGDVAHYTRKLKLILTGFAEVATAAHAMYPRVHPEKALHFEHSTTKGVPGGSAQQLHNATSTSSWGGP